MISIGILLCDTLGCLIKGLQVKYLNKKKEVSYAIGTKKEAQSWA